MTDKTQPRNFPVLGADRRDAVPGTPKRVPWSLLAPHERQAQRNHYLSLRQLASRGGLSVCEMVADLEDRDWRKMDRQVALDRLNELIAQHSERDVVPTAGTASRDLMETFRYIAGRAHAALANEHDAAFTAKAAVDIAAAISPHAATPGAKSIDLSAGGETLDGHR